MVLQTKEKVYTTAEAADYLGLAEDTVRKLVQRKLLSPDRQIGKSHIFLQSELDRYHRERRPSGNPEFQRKTPRKRSA